MLLYWFLLSFLHGAALAVVAFDFAPISICCVLSSCLLWLRYTRGFFRTGCLVLLAAFLVVGTARGQPPISDPAWIEFLREKLRVPLEDHDALAVAWLNLLLFGVYSGSHALLTEAFRGLGLFHLIVISGLHVTLLGHTCAFVLHLPARLGYFLAFLNSSQERRWVTLSRVSSLVLLGLYAWVVDWHPPVQRAYLLFALGQLTHLCGVSLDRFVRWALVASAQAVLFPRTFGCVSFLMSWFVYALIVTMPRGFWQGILNQVVIFSLCLIFFGSASWWGVFLNLALSPFFPLLYGFSLLVYVTGKGWEALETLLVYVLEGLIRCEWNLSRVAPGNVEGLSDWEALIVSVPVFLAAWLGLRQATAR